MTSSPDTTSPPWRGDTLLVWIVRGAAAVAAGIVVLVLGFLLLEAAPALGQIGFVRFLRDGAWHPRSGQFGMVAMVVATLLVALGAVLLAAPVGLGSALFARFCAPPLVGTAYRRLIELLAGIPSVVYGFWGLVVLVPMITHSLLAAVLILAVMILPTIALIAEASVAGVPADYVRSAAALGLTRWGVLRRVVVPTARCGLMTAVILALGRAIGETMAVLMVCGNVVQVPRTLLDPVRTLTANIALEMAYAADLHRATLFVGGLLLMGIAGVIVAGTEWLGRMQPSR